MAYVYIRRHYAYDKFNACKFGITTNIPQRDTQYATGEIQRGTFEPVIEMSDKNSKIFEKMFQNYSNSLGYHIKYDGGKEFFNIKILDILIPYLDKTNIEYRILSKDEISRLIRKERLRKISDILNKRLKKKKGTLKKAQEKTEINQECSVITPRDYQKDIIEKANKHFENNSKGMLVLTCGLGKTLLSLWIAKECGAKKILIGVPNKQLLFQWMDEINKKLSDIFNCPILCVSGNKSIQDISMFVKDKNEYIIITTYSSSYKVLETDVLFDFKINDEAHHLSSHHKICDTRKKRYVKMLEIKATKQLSLTATLKTLEKEKDGEDDIIFSNDNIEQFGEIIDKKTLLWGIQKNIICDYVVQTVACKDIEDLDIFDSDKNLMISAYAALKSLCENNSHHILICCNSIQNAHEINKNISYLLKEYFNNDNSIYYSVYDSKMSAIERNNIEEKFKNALKGIIICVYCLGEGWNVPLLDAIVVAENMTSNIRIVQTVLRPNRKDDKQPNKICKIILPIYIDDWLNKDSQEFKKVRDVIYQLGLEDETIEQKVKVFDMIVKKPKNNKDDTCENAETIYGSANEDLTVELKLRTIKRIALDITFEKAKKILSGLNIKSKAEYYKVCENDNRLSIDPEEQFYGQFTNWSDYLGIDRSLYYDLEECKKKVNEFLKVNNEFKGCLDVAKICKELCEIDNKFPSDDLWCEYYGIKELGEIIKPRIIRKTTLFL